MNEPKISHDDKPIKTIETDKMILSLFVIVVEVAENPGYILYRFRLTNKETQEEQEIDLNQSQVKSMIYFLGF